MRRETMDDTEISRLERQIYDETFDMDPEAIRTLGYHAVDIMVDYLNNIPNKPILSSKKFQEMTRLLNEPLPKDEQDPHAILEECHQKILANAVQIGHPRLLGWMLPSGTPIGAFADGIASTINQNVSVSGSTVATTLEILVIDWMKQILGYDPKAAGILVSGGSEANLTALAVARNSKTNVDIPTQGMSQQQNTMTIYASEEVHSCIPKAVQLLGIGTQNIRWIHTDEHYCLDIQDLKTKIQDDTTSGKHPFCVVATAGTVNTGAVDPLDKIADICRDYNLWFHIDAAYGGFTALSKTFSPALKGIDRADSVVLDPHKWLFIPYEAGCVLVKNKAAMKQTFVNDASYIHLKKNETENNEEMDFSDYGIQLSRQFRALKIWMSLKQYGVQRYQHMIEQNIYLAHYLQALIQESKDFETAAPVGLSTVCFRYFPQDLRQQYTNKPEAEKEKINEYLNRMNRMIIEGMRTDPRILLSSTILQKQFVLRACIMNYRTTKQDIKNIIDITRELGEKEDQKLRKSFM
jgi:aromatic-L-amino-acid/L-tryptophan decarboxylase